MAETGHCAACACKCSRVRLQMSGIFTMFVPIVNRHRMACSAFICGWRDFMQRVYSQANAKQLLLFRCFLSLLAIFICGGFLVLLLFCSKFAVHYYNFVPQSAYNRREAASQFAKVQLKAP